jgi:predicted enzyme related to lactoylglutathione lyase
MKFEFSPYIAVQVKDHQKAVKFYENALGMVFIESKENDTYLKSGPVTFVIENAPVGAHKAVFFEFKVDNIKDAKNILEKKGCKILKTYNEKSIMFSDPYGMNFHVFEE